MFDKLSLAVTVSLIRFHAAFFMGRAQEMIRDDKEGGKERRDRLQRHYRIKKSVTLWFLRIRCGRHQLNIHRLEDFRDMFYFLESTNYKLFLTVRLFVRFCQIAHLAPNDPRSYFLRAYFYKSIRYYCRYLRSMV